jgi:hypothetical protein
MNPKQFSGRIKLFQVVDFDTVKDLSAIKMFFTHERHSKLIELRDRIFK